MKYVNKIPPADKELQASLIKEYWRKIKEPSNLFTAIILSIPFMILAVIVSFFIIILFNPTIADTLQEFINTGSFSLIIRLDYILFAYLFIISHELFHAALIPGFLKSEKVFFGIRPWGGFVFTTETLGKARFLLITIAPFLILSVILPVFLGLFGLLTGVMIFLILLNAAASSVDLLSAFLITVQVPNGSKIVNNGFETYYK